MNNYNIYLVITAFFPTPTNFRGPYIYDQVKAIIATNKYKRVVVLSPCPWYIKSSDYEYGGINVYNFTEYELPSSMCPGSGAWLSKRSLDNCLKKLNIKYEDISVVHSHVTRNALYANHIKNHNPNIVTIVQHHGFDVLGLNNGYFRKRKWHKRLTIKYAQRILKPIDIQVGVSQATLDYLLRYPGINSKKTYVLYNGVDTNKFYFIPKTKKNDIFKIGCIGNFTQIKDQITLIKAVELLIKQTDNIEVNFVGSGPKLSWCKNYVESNNLEKYIRFLPEVDHSRLNDFYNTLDLFVLPSYYDAFGCVYLEAYACGVPFVSARGSGINEFYYKEDECNWAINRHDFKSLADIIIRQMYSPKQQMLRFPYNINSLVTNFIEFIDNEF